MLSKLNHFKSMAPVGVMRYSGNYLIRPESVPDHISECTTLALMMIKDLRSLGVEVNKELLIYKIAIHDIPEAVTSDIVRPFKYHHKALTREINKAELAMITDAGYPQEIIDDINNAKSNDTIEGSLMRLVDILQVNLKLKEEVEMLGNKLMEDPLKDSIKTLRQIVKTISGLHGHVFDNYINSLTSSIYG